MAIFRARAVLTPEGMLDDAVVETSGEGAIVAVRGSRPSDLPALDGVILPGLVNAHTHLELSWLHGKVPGGEGLPRWVGQLFVAQREAVSEEARLRAMRDAAAWLARFGTAAVSDVSNGGDTGEILVEAGISGVVQWELLTLDAKRLGDQLQKAAIPDREVRGDRASITVRPAPHALYSTAPALVRACVRGGSVTRPPASLHVAEDREEVRFIRDGSGAWAHFLDRIGVDWRWWEAPGCTPVEMLEEMGVLGPGLLAVHGVHLTPHDRVLLASSGTPLCLCPSSNAHIGRSLLAGEGDLPDVSALLRAGVRLCLGTDSLASAPDLDVLREAAYLRGAFPDVDPVTWLQMATRGGAEALRMPHLGSIAVSKRPGLLLIEGVSSSSTLLDAVAAAPRRWLVPPGAPA